MAYVGRVLAVPLCLLLSGCASVVGTHPFSSLPKSSGKLDKRANVLVLHGQAHQLCRTKDITELTWFVHLRNMPAQDIMASANGQMLETVSGTQATFAVNANTPAGKVLTFTITFSVGAWNYSTTTTVGPCQ